MWPFLYGIFFCFDLVFCLCFSGNSYVGNGWAMGSLPPLPLDVDKWEVLFFSSACKEKGY
jgi:hypothetical protein